MWRDISCDKCEREGVEGLLTTTSFVDELQVNATLSRGINIRIGVIIVSTMVSLAIFRSMQQLATEKQSAIHLLGSFCYASNRLTLIGALEGSLFTTSAGAAMTRPRINEREAA